MRLELKIFWDSVSDRPPQMLIWDSDRGTFGGDLAHLRSWAIGAKRRGSVKIPGPPPSWETRKVVDPLHRPEDLAALLASLHYAVPPELFSYYTPAQFPVPDAPPDTIF